MKHQGLQFVQGLFSGALISAIVLLIMTIADTLITAPLQPALAPSLDVAGNWIVRNLGYSLIPFCVVLILYVFTLRSLTLKLQQKQAVHQVTQSEHLLEVWISLFFGIGVIWTAIGMRGALIYALGDVNNDAGNAVQVLSRLVDGGMLTALSTTILGGAGGYLMRLGKTLLLGMELSNYYSSLDQQQHQSIEVLLSDIRQSLVNTPHTQKVVLQHREQQA